MKETFSKFGAAVKIEVLRLCVSCSRPLVHPILFVICPTVTLRVSLIQRSS